MTTEYRPLLTAADVVAAIANGERVEVADHSRENWELSSYGTDTLLETVGGAMEFLRYRARPAGESLGDKLRDRRRMIVESGEPLTPAAELLDPRAAEVEALRADLNTAQKLLAEVTECRREELQELKAAEARAARLEASVQYAKNLLHSALVLLKCDDEFIAAQKALIDAARSAVSDPEHMDFTDYRREHDHGAER